MLRLAVEDSLTAKLFEVVDHFGERLKGIAFKVSEVDKYTLFLGLIAKNEHR